MKWKMSSQRQCGWGFIYDNIPIYQCSEPPFLGVYQYINASPGRYAQTQEDTISDAESVLLD